MADIINPVTFQEETPIIRGYAEFAKFKIQEGYSSLETYSPSAAALLSDSLDKVQALTPEYVRDTLEGANCLIDLSDELLQSALERTAEFPALIEELKSKLTKEQLVDLLETIKEEAGSKVVSLSEFLPSSQLDNLDVKQRVEQIVEVVLSQPQLMKEKASGYAENLREQLDKDQDGIVTVKDLANVGGNALEYCTAAVRLMIPNLPKDILDGSSVQDMLSVFLENETTKPVFDSIRAQWESSQTVADAFRPLWGAMEVLKAYVMAYTENVTCKFQPLSPYLMELLGGTSVVDLPMEIMLILTTVTGFVQDKERDGIVRETRALFWALIDISFLLEVLKENKISDKQVVDVPEAMEGVELLDDAEALKRVNEWAQAYGQMELA